MSTWSMVQASWQYSLLFSVDERIIKSGSLSLISVSRLLILFIYIYGAVELMSDWLVVFRSVPDLYVFFTVNMREDLLVCGRPF